MNDVAIYHQVITLGKRLLTETEINNLLTVAMDAIIVNMLSQKTLDLIRERRL